MLFKWYFSIFIVLVYLDGYECYADIIDIVFTLDDILAPLVCTNFLSSILSISVSVVTSPLIIKLIYCCVVRVFLILFYTLYR